MGAHITGFYGHRGPFKIEMADDASDAWRRKTLLLATAAATLTAAAAVAAAVAAVVETRRRKARSPLAVRSYAKRVRAARPAAFELKEFEELLAHLGISFESYFRLPRALFGQVLADIRPRLASTNSVKGLNSCGHAITPEHRLAIALRFFAGALWQDIVVSMRPVCKTQVFQSVWLAVDAINNEYAGKWDYPRPAQGAPADEWEKATAFYSMLESRFRDKSPEGCMRGVVGAIDGCIIRVKCPGGAVPNPADHYCQRKKTYGMLLMAAADADMVIRSWSVAFTPKCHDSTAWAGSSLGAWVNAGGLPWPFCFLGDNAFRPGSASLLTPGGRSTSDSYKYVQSRGRMPAEQCFGILMRTWGVLWRELGMRYDRRGPLVSCLIHLHNVRRTAGAPLKIEAGHQERVHDGIRQWGLPQQRVVGGVKTVDTVWVTAPQIDESGRPTELMGPTKSAFQEGASPVDFSPPPGARSVTDRMKLLEDSIAAAAVMRPQGKR